MKLVQAMKLVKELLVKADDLRKKIASHSAHLNIETPVYKDQTSQIETWLQAHVDIMQEIGRLRVAIARTNLATKVTMKMGDKNIEKTITEWIVRRTVTAALDAAAIASLTDRNLKEQDLITGPGSPVTQIRIVRCYYPKARDNALAIYKDEPGLIDRTLEVVNATTDLIE
jgi:hypothetical protein